MLPIILLSLLGIGASAFVLDQVFDDDDDDALAPEEDTPRPDNIDGTNGDDILWLPQNGSFNVDAGAGDDYINDQVPNVVDELPEDIHDDTGPVQVDGGAGDDYITMAHLGEQDATIAGGEGDDTIRLDEASENTGIRSISLGEGADVFSTTLAENPPPDTTPIGITDFDPAEDLLVFEVRFTPSLQTLVDAGDVSMEITQEQVEGTNDTAVTFSLSNLRDDGEESILTQTVVLENSGPIPDEAIRLQDIVRFSDDEIGPDVPLVLTGSPGEVITVEADTIVITGTGDDEVLVNNSTTSSYLDNRTTVYTGAGDDTVTSLDDDRATIFTGEGDDQITYQGESSVLFGESGNDTITAGGSLVSSYGGTGDDVLTDEGIDNFLYGEEGNDTITGSASSLIFGGSGDDLIIVNPDDFLDTANYTGTLLGVAAGDEGNDVIEMHMGQAVNMGGYGAFDQPDESGDDLLRLNVLDEHLDRGPALVLRYGENDQIELTASQSVQNDIEIETNYADDGSAVGYLLTSNGTEIMDLRMAYSTEVTDPPPSLSDLNITLVPTPVV